MIGARELCRHAVPRLAMSGGPELEHQVSKMPSVGSQAHPLNSKIVSAGSGLGACDFRARGRLARDDRPGGDRAANGTFYPVQ